MWFVSAKSKKLASSTNSIPIWYVPFSPLVNGITSGPGILISPIHITSLLVPSSLYNIIPYRYTSPRLRDFIQLLVTASSCVGLAVGNPLYVRISFASLASFSYVLSPIV